jgi:hypothetical protein
LPELPKLVIAEIEEQELPTIGGNFTHRRQKFNFNFDNFGNAGNNGIVRRRGLGLWSTDSKIGEADHAPSRAAEGASCSYDRERAPEVCAQPRAKPARV